MARRQGLDVSMSVGLDAPLGNRYAGGETEESGAIAGILHPQAALAGDGHLAAALREEHVSAGASASAAGAATDLGLGEQHSFAFAHDSDDEGMFYIPPEVAGASSESGTAGGAAPSSLELRRAQREKEMFDAKMAAQRERAKRKAREQRHSGATASNGSNLGGGEADDISGQQQPWPTSAGTPSSAPAHGQSGEITNPHPGLFGQIVHVISTIGRRAGPVVMIPFLNGAAMGLGQIAVAFLWKWSRNR